MLWLLHQKKIITVIVALVVLASTIPFIVHAMRTPLLPINMTIEDMERRLDEWMARALIQPWTRQDFLGEAEFIMDMLENNSPFFSLIYDVYGTDMAHQRDLLTDWIKNGVGGFTFGNYSHLIHNLYLNYISEIGGVGFINRNDYWWMTEIWMPYVITNHNMQAHVDGIMGAIDDDVHAWFTFISQDMITSLEEWFRPTNNITTEIKDGVGIINLTTLADRINPYDQAVLNSFFGQTSNFDDIIIDMRGVRGSFPSYFQKYIISPLANQTLTAEFNHITTTYSQLVSYTIMPSGNGFYGDIWILIDENTGGGSNFVLAFARDSGFATLVGQPTALGISGSLNIDFFTAPLSGNIMRYNPLLKTDIENNALVLGIEPHYFNYGEKDAMKTTLTLITK